METLLIFGLIIAFFLIFGKILVFPLKVIVELIMNSIVGMLTLVLVNLFGQIIGLHVEINLLNTLVAGFFGLPGTIVLIIINLI